MAEINLYDWYSNGKCTKCGNTVTVDSCNIIQSQAYCRHCNGMLQMQSSFDGWFYTGEPPGSTTGHFNSGGDSVDLRGLDFARFMLGGGRIDLVKCDSCSKIFTPVAASIYDFSLIRNGNWCISEQKKTENLVGT